jgi:hypothetical protein
MASISITAACIASSSHRSDCHRASPFCGVDAYAYPPRRRARARHLEFALRFAKNKQPTSPVQSSPVQPSPAQSSPVQPSPVQPNPVQSTLESALRFAFSPVQRPAQSSPAQSSPAQPGPVQSSPAQSSPVQCFAISSCVALPTSHTSCYRLEIRNAESLNMFEVPAGLMEILVRERRQYLDVVWTLPVGCVNPGDWAVREWACTQSRIISRVLTHWQKFGVIGPWHLLEGPFALKLCPRVHSVPLSLSLSFSVVSTRP